MLYEYVKLILDTAKAKEVDLLVARDMLIAEDKAKEAELTAACKFAMVYYKFITACRVAGDDETIEKLCQLYEEDKFDEIQELISE